MIHGDQLLNLTAKIRIHLVCEFLDHTRASVRSTRIRLQQDKQFLRNLTTNAQALLRDYENVKT